MGRLFMSAACKGFFLNKTTLLSRPAGRAYILSREARLPTHSKVHLLTLSPQSPTVTAPQHGAPVVSVPCEGLGDKTWDALLCCRLAGAGRQNMGRLIMLPACRGWATKYGAPNVCGGSFFYPFFCLSKIFFEKIQKIFKKVVYFFSSFTYR